MESACPEPHRPEQGKSRKQTELMFLMVTAMRAGARASCTHRRACGVPPSSDARALAAMAARVVARRTGAREEAVGASWQALCTRALRKLRAHLSRGDAPSHNAKLHLSALDWAAVDLLLLYDTPLLSVASFHHPAQLTALTRTCELVQRFGLEPLPGQELSPGKWNEAASWYCQDGFQLSAVALQRRWHELKLDTRLRAGELAGPRAPLLSVHQAIATRYPHVVKSGALPSWRQLVEAEKVAEPTNERGPAPGEGPSTNPDNAAADKIQRIQCNDDPGIMVLDEGPVNYPKINGSNEISNVDNRNKTKSQNSVNVVGALDANTEIIDVDVPSPDVIQALQELEVDNIETTIIYESDEDIKCNIDDESGLNEVSNSIKKSDTDNVTSRNDSKIHGSGENNANYNLVDKIRNSNDLNHKITKSIRRLDDQISNTYLEYYSATQKWADCLDTAKSNGITYRRINGVIRSDNTEKVKNVVRKNSEAQVETRLDGSRLLESDVNFVDGERTLIVSDNETDTCDSFEDKPEGIDVKLLMTPVVLMERIDAPCGSLAPNSQQSPPNDPCSPRTSSRSSPWRAGESGSDLTPLPPRLVPTKTISKRNLDLLQLCQPCSVVLRRVDEGRGAGRRVELCDIEQVRLSHRRMLTAQVAPLARTQLTMKERRQRARGRRIRIGLESRSSLEIPFHKFYSNRQKHSQNSQNRLRSNNEKIQRENRFMQPCRTRTPQSYYSPLDKLIMQSLDITQNLEEFYKEVISVTNSSGQAFVTSTPQNRMTRMANSIKQSLQESQNPINTTLQPNIEAQRGNVSTQVYIAPMSIGKTARRKVPKKLKPQAQNSSELYDVRQNWQQLPAILRRVRNPKNQTHKVTTQNVDTQNSTLNRSKTQIKLQSTSLMCQPINKEKQSMLKTLLLQDSKAKAKPLKSKRNKSIFPQIIGITCGLPSEDIGSAQAQGACEQASSSSSTSNRQPPQITISPMLGLKPNSVVISTVQHNQPNNNPLLTAMLNDTLISNPIQNNVYRNGLLKDMLDDPMTGNTDLLVRSMAHLAGSVVRMSPPTPIDQASQIIQRELIPLETPQMSHPLMQVSRSDLVVQARETSQLSPMQVPQPCPNKYPLMLQSILSHMLPEPTSMAPSPEMSPIETTQMLQHAPIHESRLTPTVQIQKTLKPIQMPAMPGLPPIPMLELSKLSMMQATHIPYPISINPNPILQMPQMSQPVNVEESMVRIASASQPIIQMSQRTRTLQMPQLTASHVPPLADQYRPVPVTDNMRDNSKGHDTLAGLTQVASEGQLHLERAIPAGRLFTPICCEPGKSNDGEGSALLDWCGPGVPSAEWAEWAVGREPGALCALCTGRRAGAWAPARCLVVSAHARPPPRAHVWSLKPRRKLLLPDDEVNSTEQSENLMEHVAKKPPWLKPQCPEGNKTVEGTNEGTGRAPPNLFYKDRVYQKVSKEPLMYAMLLVAIDSAQECRSLIERGAALQLYCLRSGSLHSIQVQKTDEGFLLSGPFAAEAALMQLTRQLRQLPPSVTQVNTDPAHDGTDLTQEAKAQNSSTDNRVGQFVCRLCHQAYGDAFALSQHHCSIMGNE